MLYRAKQRLPIIVGAPETFSTLEKTRKVEFKVEPQRYSLCKAAIFSSLSLMIELLIVTMMKDTFYGVIVQNKYKYLAIVGVEIDTEIDAL